LRAKELITNNVPVLKPEDTGQTALNWMDMLKVSHLPVVKEEEYLGLISDKIIYDLNLTEETIDKQVLQLHSPHIHEDKHIFEAASVMYNLGLTVLPVLNQANGYVGTITLIDIWKGIASLLSLNEPGGIIILNIPEHSFSLTEISQIVESNDTKVLSLVTHKPVGSEMLNITLKLDKLDLSGVIQTFERYSYQVASVFMDDSLLHDLYEDRLEQFLRYLNI
jgi:predicted transcriptional regulator